jgi:GNAT superfamily N-acetyltransferase
VPEIEVRPFRRSDRDQVAALVNAHVKAVLPGPSIPVNAVLSQLEREPGEFIVDPWVSERATLVAEQRGRVVAAGHLLRYAADRRVGESYRDAGEIRWLLCWPDAPYWLDATAAGEELAAACLAQLRSWGVARAYADGALPAPGVYGIPEQWPHVRAILEIAGFAHEGTTEIVLVARTDELAQPGPAPLDGLEIRRTLGVNGTRLSATLGAQTLGFIEVDVDLSDAGRRAGLTSWADVGNLHVGEDHRGRGIGRWLLGHAGEWLRLAGAERVLDYTTLEDEACLRFLVRSGFRELTRTRRGWSRTL